MCLKLATLNCPGETHYRRGFFMQRIYHPYTDWEDYKAGMWSPCSEDRIQEAIEFMRNTLEFGEWMQEVTKQWPLCTAHNLTNLESNRKSWIGQAACCLAKGISEHITRAAWMKLSEDKRKEANQMAQIAIEKWEKYYLQTTS